MTRRAQFLLAAIVGTVLALVFAQFDPVQVQQALQQLLGVAAAPDPARLPALRIALLAAFVVGASMVVTPCLIPLIFTFVPASREARSRADIVTNLLSYTLGMLIVSAAIGLVVGFLGGQIVGFLSTFQPIAKKLSIIIFSGMGAVFLLWGMRAFHLIDLPSTGFYYRLTDRIEDAPGGEHSRALLYGAAVGTALGISCPIPTYHAILLWTAVVGSPLYGLFLLSALGLGRVLPLWVLVALPEQRVEAFTDWATDNPERIHAINGVVVTVVGSFLLVFWLGVMYLRLL